jgi:dihydroorotate dehydrogenase (NAD+) catalytic subunit
VDLSCRIGPLRLPNPILLASGTFGGLFDRVLDLSRVGAVILKTVTREPLKGNPPPRIHETASGMLNSIGLENKGLEAFLEGELPRALDWDTRVIVSISGEDEKDYTAIARRLRPFRRIVALELNISCPNVSHGMDWATDPRRTRRVVRAVRRVSPFPLIAKLTPNVTDVVPIARAAMAGGADALSLVNTFKGIAIDWRRRRPVLGGVTGGLSGPAIKPIALRLVWDVCRALPSAPVVGIGGIASADDVLEFMAAGACAVQIGTANFSDAQTSTKVLDDLRRALATAGVQRARDLVGAAARGSATASRARGPRR